MQKLSRQVVVTNHQGLHARPANMVVQCAQQYDSAIEVAKDGNRVDAKSILQLLMLAAEKDSRLILYAQGSDADQALEALAQLFDRGFDEDAEQPTNTASSHTAGENLP